MIAQNLRSSVTQLPVVAGLQIPQDVHGRFNLNVLHRASGLGEGKKPSRWLSNESTKELIRSVNVGTDYEKLVEQVRITPKGLVVIAKRLAKSGAQG